MAGARTRYRHIEVSTLTPTIGAEISGIDLNGDVGRAAYNEIKKALWRHHVIFIRGQTLTPEAYIRLGEQFGAVAKHEFFPHVDGYPQIQTINHQGRDNPETDRWHTDVTFRPEPTLVTLLQAKELPAAGGDTLWASTGAAFDALPDPLKTCLLSLKAEHDLPYRMRKIDFYRRTHSGRIQGAKQGRDEREHEQMLIDANPVQLHPAVINHPVTGRLSLFVNSIWTKRLMDVHEDLSDALLGMLHEWIKKPEFQVRFRWEPDAIAIWDNLATQHFAVFDYAPAKRSMWRMTAGAAAPKLDLKTVPAAVRPKRAAGRG